MVRNRSKIKASSLIEPLVSIMVISSVLMIASFSINNLVSFPSNIVLKQKAWNETKKMVEKAKKEKNWQDEKYESEQFTIEKNIELNSNGLVVIQMKVKNKSGANILNYKEIVDSK